MKYLALDDIGRICEKDILLVSASERLNDQVSVRIRALTAWEVLEGMPEVTPGTNEFVALGKEGREEVNLQWEKWGDALVSRAVIQPEGMDADHISKLGPDRMLLYKEVMAFSGLAGSALSPFRPKGEAHDQGIMSGNSSAAAGTLEALGS